MSDVRPSFFFFFSSVIIWYQGYQLPPSPEDAIGTERGRRRGAPTGEAKKKNESTTGRGRGAPPSRAHYAPNGPAGRGGGRTCLPPGGVPGQKQADRGTRALACGGVRARGPCACTRRASTRRVHPTSRTLHSSSAPGATCTRTERRYTPMPAGLPTAVCLTLLPA